MVWWTQSTALLAWSLLVLAKLPKGTLAAAAALKDVRCPSTQRVFTAVTEMVFTGRSEFFSVPEGNSFTQEFLGVYNGVTQSTCDRYFRRLAKITLVNMTNSQGDFIDLEMRQEQGEDYQFQQDLMELMDSRNSSSSSARDGKNNTRTTTNNHDNHGRGLQQSVVVNATEGNRRVPSINMIYEATGTCRGCPLTSSGSFELYDDTFRRQLLDAEDDPTSSGNGSGDRGVRIRTRFLRVEDRSLQDADASTTSEDCQCVQGVLPMEARAPGVQECVDLMNDKFDTLRQETIATDTPLYQNIEMANLIQLDDLDALELGVGP